MSDEVESSWRIRAGAGLLSAAPLNPELQEAHRKEDEKERKQAEFAAQLRADAELERNAELLRLGHRPRTQAEFLADVGWAQDRQDAADRKAEERAAELAGRPPRYLGLLREAKEARKEREAAAEVEPASKAELDRGLKKLALTVSNTFGKKLLS